MSPLEARIVRFKNSREKLLGLAKELKEKHGCKVYASSDLVEGGTLLFFEVRKDDHSTMVGFSEVPYHWYIGNSVNGKKYRLQGEYGFDLPFGVNDVIVRMKPCSELVPTNLKEL